MTLYVSGFYCALTTFLALFLSARVVQLRVRFKVGVGNGEHPEIYLARRAHGNLLENAPLGLLLLAIAELDGLHAGWLHLFGTVMLVSRLLHAIGLTQGKGGPHMGRMLGMLGTWGVMVALAVVDIVMFLEA
ncbi:MAPEG family protein [Shewanella yunxiaonensis]|uniref:MAPEG family protein n=1 Tax=Shewanella yunxiaonensis TaxID=2829809 RepID=A0ABX7YZH2_9GAMM|nr:MULTISPECIES: MAPEG family protein [Shewanella]MDF0535032.1 MAPEG family protein [Shewanella sp. A32]QUN07696.1 MAPEG family protein [Shewanella yunxiaonensis]